NSGGTSPASGEESCSRREEEPDEREESCSRREEEPDEREESCSRREEEPDGREESCSRREGDAGSGGVADPAGGDVRWMSQWLRSSSERPPVWMRAKRLVRPGPSGPARPPSGCPVSVTMTSLPSRHFSKV